MKKLCVFGLKTSLLITFFCFTALGVGWTQAEMSLWYIPDSKHQDGHTHGTNSEFLIPCGWNYYHRYDGEDQIIEYGIRNEGDAPLTLSLPLSFESGSSKEFVIMEQPSKAILQPGDDIHFKVQYRALGAYQPAKAILNISNDAPNNSGCSLDFRVGGGPLPVPFDPSLCYKEIVSSNDFGADNSIEETVTTTRTLDERNNVIESVEILADDMGNERGRFTIISTYTTNNDLITETVTAGGILGGFITGEMTTNTYDSNNNLIKTVLVRTAIFGDFTLTEEHTYDPNNRRISTKRTSISFGPPQITNITYTYDVNGNLLTETHTQNTTGLINYRITNTYEANNNLVTSSEEILGTLAIITTNTYNTDNQLTESLLVRPGLFESTTTNTYNSFGKLVTQSIESEDFFFGDNTIQNLTFTYDENQRLIGRVTETSELGFPPNFKEISSITPCDLPQISIADPCSCGDPLNKKDNQDIITHFHDVLSVNGTSGDAVILQMGNTNFLDNNLTQIADGTMLGTIPPSGTLTYDFFHASGAITLEVGGVLSNPFNISVCSAKDCVVIPTMSQWGW